MKRVIIDKILSNKILVKNYFFVSILNVLALFLPLITYPYIISKLGDELYGYIVFSFTVITYIEMVAAWGFDISAVKDVAQYQHVKHRLNEIVSSVLYIRFIFCMFLLSLLVGALMLFDVKMKMLYILFSGHCIASVLFPGWFFQGIQELKYVTYFQLICKLVFVILMVVFIHSKADYLYYPILFSLGSLFGTAYGLYVMFEKYKVRLIGVKMRNVVYRFKRSTSIFYSRIADMIIERSNAILLGNFIGMQEVAYYDLANKIVRLGSFPIMILNQVLYPKVASERNFRLMRKVMAISFWVAILIWGLCVLLAPWGVELLGKGLMEPSVEIVYILSPLIVTNSIIYLQGSPILVAAGYFKAFNITMWCSLGVYVACMLFAEDDSLLIEDEEKHKRHTNMYATAVFQLILAIGLGTIFSWLLTKTGLTFPIYIGAMLAAALIRNIAEYTNFTTIHMGEINDFGGISLSLFLGMAMITLKLWELASLALPLVILLAAQTLLIGIFTYFVVFRIMGHDYDAAVLAAGTCGFGMGATPNAMANMQALCDRFVPSVKAYLLIPLVGSLFADFINSLVITFFINII